MVLFLFPALSQGQVCSGADDIPRSAWFPMSNASLTQWLGFDPEQEAQSDYTAARDKWSSMDIAALRQHAWMLWSALTADSKTSRPPATRPSSFQTLPRWQTWYPAEDVLRASLQPPPNRLKFSPDDQRMLLLEFPRQLRKPEPPSRNKQIAPVRESVVLSSALYNSVTCEQIVTHHLGDSGVKNNLLYNKKTHDITSFQGHEDAMALKTMWMRISRDGCDHIPVWDGIPGVPKATDNQNITWPRTVSVRVRRGQVCGNSSSTVDLDDFYWYQLGDPKEVDRIQSLFPPDGVHTGDFMILVGMHVATREIPNWVWSTFWWHDHPVYGAFAADRPSPSLIRGTWRHYLMDTAYDMDRPWQSTAQPKATFNPYLEGDMPDGVRSNCMTCHRRAAWPVPNDKRETLSSKGVGLEFRNIVVTGSEAATASYFPEYEDLLRLSFLWTLARPDPPPN